MACCARATTNGTILFDGVSDQRYLELIEEEVRSWSYMKFPHLREPRARARLVPRGAAGPGAKLRLHSHATR
jgi:coenzyme F420-reducing hydrogenase alpha subunit